jgi:CDP-diacylglycerol---serine O-phosphatidyltransferase
MQNNHSILRHIPNFITCLNLLSGCISIVLIYKDFMVQASYFIFLAAILDFLDGMFARALKSYSEIGKQLDSLADLISFGVAPASIMFSLLNMSLVSRDISFSFEFSSALNLVVLFSAFLIAIFSALRLAKFNIDDKQKNSFIGLPVPANALFFASICIILFKNENAIIQQIILNVYVLLSLVILSSFILVSHIPMFALKFKNLSFKENRLRYIFIIISVLLLIIWNVYAIPLIIVLYIVLSVLNNIVFKIA